MLSADTGRFDVRARRTVRPICALRLVVPAGSRRPWASGSTTATLVSDFPRNGKLKVVRDSSASFASSQCSKERPIRSGMGLVGRVRSARMSSGGLDVPDAGPAGSLRVFLSYAHDDLPHEEAVREFYEFLRVDCGIDAVFDRVAAQSPQEWTVWMLRAMAEADFVLCVVSPEYRAAAEAELPGDIVGRSGRAVSCAKSSTVTRSRPVDGSCRCSCRAGRWMTFRCGSTRRARRVMR